MIIMDLQKKIFHLLFYCISTDQLCLSATNLVRKVNRDWEEERNQPNVDHLSDQYNFSVDD